MNYTLSTTTGRHEHPPHTIHANELRPVRRVGLLDRMALHLGVALIKWGRRPYLTGADLRQAIHLQRQLERLEYQRAAERAYWMLVRMR